MKEIGEFLKASRLERGMTLQEISNITKISTRYLDGIEKGDWSMMPGNFYVRGFIRNYAKVLGVDISGYLENLNREMVDDPTPVSPLTSPTSAPVRAYRFGKLFSTSLVVVLLLVVFLVVFRYVANMDVADDKEPLNGQQQINEQQPEPPELEPLPEKEEPVTELPYQESVADIEFVEQSQNTYMYRVKNVTELQLRIDGNQGESWYQVRDGNGQGTVQQEGKIQNGEQLEFANGAGLWIRLGNFRAVSLYINDQPIEIDDQGNSASVRNYQFEIVNQ